MVPRAPSGLRRGGWGRRVWRRLTKRYQMREDELLVLEKLALNEDVLERLETEAATAPLYIEGSRGQQVQNPIFDLARQHRLTSAKLLGQLGFADALDADGRAKSSAGRKMALTRWAGRR
jgi:hypothetical protein